MDLLVQQKIQAAMQPLFEKINSLEEQLKKMALQIQTIQNENQIKHNSQLANSIQIQTQQTRLEHKLGTERSKINKHPVTDKMNNKKENTGAKAQPKTEMPQIHGTKKEVKRQPAKSFKSNGKENKAESHLTAQKSKKPLEQKQSQKMMKQPAEQMVQKFKIEVVQPSLQKIDEMNTIQEGKQKADQSTQNRTDLNQIKENVEMMPEKHQIVPQVKQSTNEMQEQEQMLIPVQNNEEVNIVIMPCTLAESIVYEMENSNEPSSQSHQNQKVDSKILNISKEQPNQSQTHDKQTQQKIQTSQAPEIMQQMQSPQKQDHKPAGKLIKEQKVLSNLSSKKEPSYRKKTEQNREKMNKSMMINKQKTENKPKKDTVKESNIKQKNAGKSVDPMKKIKAKEDPKTEKKPSEATKTENVLNEQDAMKGKQEVEKQTEENLLAQTKADIEA